jgi:curved DNA-binding protein
MADELYSVLGVERTATKEDIKKAFRKHARLHHPDRAEGDAQSARIFREVNDAYAVLSDERQRALYDEFGGAALRKGFDATRARSGKKRKREDGRGPDSQRGTAHTGTTQAGVRRIRLDALSKRLIPGADVGTTTRGVLDSFLGRQRYAPGDDHEVDIGLSFVEALRGITIQFEDAVGRAITKISVAPGTIDGATQRIGNLGGPGVNGGLSGDLIVIYHVAAHSIFRREGPHLHLDLPVSVSEAYLGCQVAIPTVDGSVKVRIPPLAQNGAVLRVRGKGAPGLGPDPSTRGDLLLRVVVRIPEAESKEVTALMTRLKAHEPDDLRAAIKL